MSQFEYIVGIKANGVEWSRSFTSHADAIKQLETIQPDTFSMGLYSALNAVLPIYPCSITQIGNAVVVTCAVLGDTVTMEVNVGIDTVYIRERYRSADTVLVPEFPRDINVITSFVVSKVKTYNLEYLVRRHFTDTLAITSTSVFVNHEGKMWRITAVNSKGRLQLDDCSSVVKTCVDDDIYTNLLTIAAEIGKKS